MRTSVKVVLITSAAAAVVALFAKRQAVGRAVVVVTRAAGTLVYDLRDKLPWSNKPSPELIDAIGKASAKYPKVPVLILIAVSRNESNFRVGSCDNPLRVGTFRRERGSWNKHKGEQIPGSDKRWSDFYQPEEWGSYGPFQTLPFHLVGKGKPFAAGTPLCKGHDPYISAEVAAKLLSDAYSKYGNWVNALAAYNGGSGGAHSSKIIGGYVKHVAKHLTDLGAEARALLPEQIAGLSALDDVPRLDSYPVYNGSGRIIDWVDVLPGDRHA